MKTAYKLERTLLFLFTVGILLSFRTPEKYISKTSFPWKQAGLTERQAAAHLLNRFSFGPKPGDVDAVVKKGLENWFMEQLEGELSEDEVNKRLVSYDALGLSNTEIVNTYVRPARVLKMAIDEGAVDKDSVNKEDKKAYREKLKPFMEKKGFKPVNELQRQFISQKVIRAAYAQNQLREVLTDFWFNHFNVSVTKNDCAEFIPAYERDVIRKNATGKFEDILLATAKSPAMLMYLDNFSSAGSDENTAKMGGGNFEKRMKRRLESKMGDSAAQQAIGKLKAGKKAQGLNENYAREVMELHTLGVDGGYTQKDVTEAARILTGWTVYPMGDFGPAKGIRKVIETVGEDNLQRRGFYHEGDFLFAANRHDIGEKTVLGKKFEAGKGYEEGVALLQMLAHHPSTAKFISRKLAARFVSDNPPATLVDKMSQTFLNKNGDIKEVLLTMVSSPEFWTKQAIREKTKSPFELVISAARSLNAEIKMPYQLYNVTNKIGQKLYAYQAPTGYPDRAQYWINTGALLNRMKFGLALASGKIPGVKIDLLALNQGHEPESTEAALRTYSKILLPERDAEETVKRLTPLLNDPELEKKVDKAADKASPNLAAAAASDEADGEMMNYTKTATSSKIRAGSDYSSAKSDDKSNMLTQVVGIIIGSPEYQRR